MASNNCDSVSPAQCLSSLHFPPIRPLGTKPSTTIASRNTSSITTSSSHNSSSTTQSFFAQTGIHLNVPTSSNITDKILLSNSQPTNHSLPSNTNLQCHICMRHCKNKTGLKLHLKSCKPTVSPKPLTQQHNSSSQSVNTQQPNSPFNENQFEKLLQDSTQLQTIYNTIVYWRKNLFNLPSGGAGKKFIKETTRLINAWTLNSTLRPIAIKLIMIMPALLLQKTSPTSKGKEHTETLKRRMELWDSGKIDELFFEATSIQKRLKPNVGSNSENNISKKFAGLMKNGKVSAAVKLLTENAQGGILPLNDETINLLREKHPEGKDTDPNCLLEGEIEPIHPSVFETISAAQIQEAALRTKGGSGPSGMDADNWRKILGGSKYGLVANDLREAMAIFTRKLCTEKVELLLQNDGNITSSLEALLACRLVPLNKDPGVRPVGVGEVLRRIIGKVVMVNTKNDVINCVGNIQVCAGQKGGSEAAIHAMRAVYDDGHSHAVLLVDASNAFNSLNRKTMLHNVGRLCPMIYTFVYNCYTPHARLFVIGGKELRSKEGTTQGDPIAMAVYAIGSVPFLKDIVKSQPDDNVKQVAFADDATAGGVLTSLRLWWEEIVQRGHNYGYFANASKTWLIVKEAEYETAINMFRGTGVNITMSGKRHLGAALGTIQFRHQYTNDLVKEWTAQIIMLAEIARSEPHAAYTCFTHGLRHRFNYFMRTIPGIAELLQPVEDSIRNRLLPSLTEGYICNDHERDLIALPVRLGGLGIINPVTIADSEYDNSTRLTAELTQSIISQGQQQPDPQKEKDMRKEVSKGEP